MTKKYTFFSWNVNGIRSVLNKGALQGLLAEKSPDFLCLQETKARSEQAETDFEDYDEFWNSAVRPGYSGTAIFCKNKPTSVYKNFAPFETELNLPSNDSDLPIFKTAKTATTSESQKTETASWHDRYGSPLTEGRVLTVEFPEFFLTSVYTPNSKTDLSRLNLRESLWDPTFLKYLCLLDRKKPVIVCGDFNAAHEEIDLARPKTNHHHAGFTNEERQGITNLISADFIDTFRFLHPDAQRYTWWSHFAHARENNVGWRIDYFFISRRLEKNLVSAKIHENIFGSDHCPISLTLEFK